MTPTKSGHRGGEREGNGKLPGARSNHSGTFCRGLTRRELPGPSCHHSGQRTPAGAGQTKAGKDTGVASGRPARLRRTFPWAGRRRRAAEEGNLEVTLSHGGLPLQPRTFALVGVSQPCNRKCRLRGEVVTKEAPTWAGGLEPIPTAGLWTRVPPTLICSVTTGVLLKSRL